MSGRGGLRRVSGPSTDEGNGRSTLAAATPDARPAARLHQKLQVLEVVEERRIIETLQPLRVGSPVDLTDAVDDLVLRWHEGPRSGWIVGMTRTGRFTRRRDRAHSVDPACGRARRARRCWQRGAPTFHPRRCLTPSQWPWVSARARAKNEKEHTRFSRCRNAPTRTPTSHNRWWSVDARTSTIADAIAQAIARPAGSAHAAFSARRSRAVP